ncbi:MAG: hypothetical protein M1833_003067 [Piccolia ochrophora]|nr:MAG: hypothetical protein M1833_003067 [Piccolia ochrophora]
MTLVLAILERATNEALSVDDPSVDALDDVSASVDALVNDDARSTPPHASSTVSESQKTLLPAPPGLSTKLLAVVEETTQPQQQSEHVLPALKPALPILPSASTAPKTAGILVALSTIEHVATEDGATRSTNVEPSAVSAAGAESRQDKQGARQAGPRDKAPAKPELDRNAHGPGKAGKDQATTKLEPPKPKSGKTALESKSEQGKSGIEGIKRTLPGKLDIAAATRNLIKETQAITAASAARKAEAQSRNARSAVTPSTNEPTPTFPTNTNPQYSIRQTQPRTLRVVSTSKADIAPAGPSVAATAPSTPAATINASPKPTAPSRRPSLASLNQPATPASDLVSDNASVTTVSLSRANSPPPKGVSKAQLKKQRKEARRTTEQKEPEEPVAKIQEPEEEIAPIIGRKKKKAKQPNSAAHDSTPATSRPPSPSLKDETKEVEAVVTPKEVLEVIAPKSPSLPPTSPAPTAVQESPVDSLTASALLASLVDSNELDPTTHPLFTPLSSKATAPRYPAHLISEAARRLALTPQEVTILRLGQHVRINPRDDADPNRLLIGPSGAFLRVASPATEERFLELDYLIRDHASSPTHFVPTDPHTSSGPRRFPPVGTAPAFFSTQPPPFQDAAYSSVADVMRGGWVDESMPTAATHGVDEIGKAWAEEKKRAAALEKKLGMMAKKNREVLRGRGIRSQ